jgi:alpha-D-xyloside xylohydrolase
LTIGARKGTYPGLVKARRLNVVLVDPANATALEPARATKSITYAGKPMSVKF